MSNLKHVKGVLASTVLMGAVLSFCFSLPAKKMAEIHYIVDFFFLE